MSSQPFPDARRASLSTLLFACAAAFTGLLLFRVHSAPAEDAAMLMRYVDHLARGRGIVWNVGDSPVDGASDFVPLLLAAGLSRAGLGAEAAARLLASGAHVLTAFVMLAAGRFRWTALLIALIVLFGPGWLYANAGFVTPVFGLLTALLVFASERRGLSGWFFAIAPLLAMTRPEGTPLVFMVGVAAMWFWRRDLRPGPLASFLAILIAYVLWRRWYFGTWIPSPYFAKGGFYLQGDGILASMNYASRFLWFAVAPLWIAFFKHDHKRTVFGILTPVAAFTVLWMLLSNQTNFGGRFQYAVLPMTAAWLAAAHSKWWPDSRGLREACAAILAAAAAANLVQYRPIPLEDGRRDVGQALARFPGPRTMVVTEAGLVPFYSNWRALTRWTERRGNRAVRPRRRAHRSRASGRDLAASNYRVGQNELFRVGRRRPVPVRLRASPPLYARASLGADGRRHADIFRAARCSGCRRPGVRDQGCVLRVPRRHHGGSGLVRIGPPCAECHPTFAGAGPGMRRLGAGVYAAC